jgi:hypothetical protein
VTIVTTGAESLTLVEAIRLALERNPDLAMNQPCCRRFRPILVTSLATILGLLPLALGLGPGAQMQQPLAIAVIGGLTGRKFRRNGAPGREVSVNGDGEVTLRGRSKLGNDRRRRPVSASASFSQAPSRGAVRRPPAAHSAPSVSGSSSRSQMLR